MGGQFLSQICELLCKQYRQSVGGLPDLVLWNPTTRACKVWLNLGKGIVRDSKWEEGIPSCMHKQFRSSKLVQIHGQYYACRDYCVLLVLCLPEFFQVPSCMPASPLGYICPWFIHVWTPIVDVHYCLLKLLSSVCWGQRSWWSTLTQANHLAIETNKLVMWCRGLLGSCKEEYFLIIMIIFNLWPPTLYIHLITVMLF